VDWSPGRSKKRRALEDPYEGVPAHVRQLLWNWIQEGLISRGPYGGFDPERVQAVSVALRLPVSTNENQQVDRFITLGNDNEAFMLDLTEAMLELYGWDHGRANALEVLLQSVNSAYMVNDSRDGLEFRIAPGAKAAVQASIDASRGSAGDHLTSAWNEAYGRKPDPSKAYTESIKAVEAALAPLVLPQNPKQTLGTMIRDVAAKPSKWRFTLTNGHVSGVDVVLSMMRLLWDGQTSRHGGTIPTRIETLEEARVAVHLAAALVQFGASSAFGPAK
jgi:hypothetical protein